ncbi:uncharacterized protein LOC142656688 [Rhinoderma darwinii]|uniref:uncharacterized protein LOC142656688 n=1 Tax=Rhinoderma darwinii TaxID=43563 RepID=UPI003F66A382
MAPPPPALPNPSVEVAKPEWARSFSRAISDISNVTQSMIGILVRLSDQPSLDSPSTSSSCGSLQLPHLPARSFPKEKFLIYSNLFVIPKKECVSSSHIGPQVFAFLCQDYQRLIVGDIRGRDQWTHGKKVTLQCPVSYCPEDVTVIWTVTDRDGEVQEVSGASTQARNKALKTSGYLLVKETDESDVDGLFNITSIITFIPTVRKHYGSLITCTVTSNGETEAKKFQPKSVDALNVENAQKEHFQHSSIDPPLPRQLKKKKFSRKLTDVYKACKYKTATMEAISKPQILDPIKVSLTDSGDVMCSLTLQNFYPKHITVKWTTEQNPLESKEDLQENTDHTYNICSRCTVQGGLFKDPNFKLSVTWGHKTMKEKGTRELSWRDLGNSFPWHPVMQEVPVPHVLTGQPNTLQYNISGYFPDAVTVRWYKKEKGGLESAPLQDNEAYKTSVTESQRQSDATYSCTARLLFTPTLRDQESEIICRVEHPSLETPLERSSGPLRVQGKPKNRKPVRVTPGKEEAKYSLTLENFYPRDIQIRWFSGSEQVTRTCPSKESYKSNIDKSFSVISECRVSEEDLKNPNFKLCVTWNHESMDDPGSKEMCIRDKDYQYRPEMKLQMPPLYNNTEASLECTISNCFPDAVRGTWLKKDKLSGETHNISGDGAYKIYNSESGRQPNNTYSYKSCLIFTPTVESHQGAEFIVQVEHPSLVRPMLKSTGALQISDSGDVHDLGETFSVM